MVTSEERKLRKKNEKLKRQLRKYKQKYKRARGASQASNKDPHENFMAKMRKMPWEEPLDEYFLASRERLGDAAFTPEMMARIKARMKTACECAARVRAAEPRLKAKINNLRAQLADHSDHPSDGE